VTINKIEQALKKKKQKPLKFTRRTAASCRLKKETVGCYALAKDVVYTLNEDELDALGDISSFDANKLRELYNALPTWLHDMADAFSKEAANTFP
jgi:hypothetical protein